VQNKNVASDLHPAKTEGSSKGYKGRSLTRRQEFCSPRGRQAALGAREEHIRAGSVRPRYKRTGFMLNKEGSLTFCDISKIMSIVNEGLKAADGRTSQYLPHPIW